MPFENTAGLNVSNFYGARETGGSVGVERSQDSIQQLSIAFTGASINSAFLPPVVIPRGAQFKRAILRVDEAFITRTLGGTTPVVSPTVGKATLILEFVNKTKV